MSFLIDLIQAAKNGWIDGWNGTTIHKSLYYPDTIDPEEEKERFLIDSEIEHLKAQKAAFMTVYQRLEKEKRKSNNKQLAAIIYRQAGIDNKIFGIDKKINKLLEKLE